ncbi:MAG: thiolase domain-containing protein [Aigarchaeota archaeon]|nr:thiolase domain-containing protein [Candidatus Pelearchaeum maunauluense]
MVNAAIVGVGHTKFGRATDKQLQELAWEAIKEALQDAGITQRDVQFVAVGNTGRWSSDPLPAVVISEYSDLCPAGSIRVEAACASGSAAVRAAYQTVASGQADIALAVGVEKMSESTNLQVVEMIGRAGNFFWEFEQFGLTFPGYYAMYATAYLHRYGAKEEDLAAIAVKNHYYADLNPHAHFHKRITIDDVMKSRYVAWPLKLFDCSPQTDGAAAVVIASEKIARKLTDTPVWIRTQAVATGTSNLSKRSNFLSLDSAVKAAEEAYKRAGVERDKAYKYFDVAEVHDCFTIAEILAYEDLGFVERGQGYALAREGETYKGGRIPVNLDGGLKAKGHPIGATGVSMAAELTKQLRQQNPPERQADIKRGWAIAHNIGGTGHYAYITIYTLDKPPTG